MNAGFDAESPCTAAFCVLQAQVHEETNKLWLIHTLYIACHSILDPLSAHGQYQPSSLIKALGLIS